MASESTVRDRTTGSHRSLRGRLGTGTGGGLLGGGTEGNARLTLAAGILLIPLFLVIGITIVRIHQLLWVHLFVGMLLIPPVLLKMASTGYRFVRYYTRDVSYVRTGPPPIELRLLAPLLMAATLLVFVTGVLLLVLGPSSRGILLLLHKVSLFAWLATAGLHVLGHLPEMASMLKLPAPDWLESLGLAPDGAGTPSVGTEGASTASTAVAGLAAHEASAGRTGRVIAIASALVAGAVLGILVIPLFHAWVALAPVR
jgi:hypothetical protein